jgi:hypothetical protein
MTTFLRAIRLYIGKEVKKMFGDQKLEPRRYEEPTIRDLNSGEVVEVISPGSFELETVLLDSAYYKFRGRDYRFLLSKARELGLKVA